MRRVVLYAFLAVVASTGGGSRSDVMSLVALRPLSVLAVGYALAVAAPEQIARLRNPLWLLLMLAAIIAIQLIPLPPSLWTALPGRGLVANIDHALGLEEMWRPWSLAPSKTLNALLSLTTPLAVILLFAVQPVPRIRHALWSLGALGAATIALSLLQIAGPIDGLLYTYRITNHGSAVGLFANRNHNAIFLASLVPLAGYFALAQSRRRPPAGEGLATSAAGGLVFLCIPTVLLSGSRAGTAALAIALALTAMLWMLLGRRRSGPSSRALIARSAPVLSIGAVVGLTVVLIASSQARSLNRLFAASPADDLRFAILPTLGELAATYFPFGSGFGSFYLVYQVAEPRDMLRPQYLNQAHNEPYQLLIEGGLPAVIVMGLFLFWFARMGLQAVRALSSARADRTASIPLLPFAWLSLAIFLATSLIDYPLRTPIIMAVAAMLTCFIAAASPEKRDGATGA